MKKRVDWWNITNKAIYTSVFVILVFGFAITLQGQAEVSEEEPLGAPLKATLRGGIISPPDTNEKPGEKEIPKEKSIINSKSIDCSTIKYSKKDITNCYKEEAILKNKVSICNSIPLTFLERINFLKTNYRKKCINFYKDYMGVINFLENNGKGIVEIYRRASTYPGDCVIVSRVIEEEALKAGLKIETVQGNHKGTFSDPDQWNFHMFNLVKVGEEIYVLDFTKDQFTRPLVITKDNRGVISKKVREDALEQKTMPYFKKLSDAKEYSVTERNANWADPALVDWFYCQ